MDRDWREKDVSYQNGKIRLDITEKRDDRMIYHFHELFII